MTKNQPRSTAIYARISLDREGNQLAVDRQLALCRKLAKDRGLRVTAEYVDNSISATSGKRRPAFEDLLASKPESITVWHIDRLVRLTKELLRVIDLGCDVYAVEAGSVDLSNPAGKAVAKTVTGWSEYEGEQKALRQRTANDQRAESGLPYARGRAFGYEADGMVIREAEAQELREAAQGVLRGRSLASLVGDLNAREIRTVNGKPWRTTTLKAALLSPRNAGLRQHRGAVIGKGQWPAIFDEATAASLRAILTDPSRARVGRPRRYLLSGALSCGKCGGPVVGAFVKGKGETYRCQSLHLTRKAEKLDGLVEALIVARLSQPDAADIFAVEEDRSRMTALSAEAAEIRSRLDGLAEAFTSGLIDLPALTAGSKKGKARLAEVEAELAASVRDPTLREIATAADVPAAWAALPVEARRHIISKLVRLTLLPATSTGRRAFDPEKELRVEWVS